MHFNVLHMQSPKVTAQFKGQWSFPNSFARSLQVEWEKKLYSPRIPLNLQGEQFSQIYWGDWFDMQGTSMSHWFFLKMDLMENTIDNLFTIKETCNRVGYYIPLVLL